MRVIIRKVRLFEGLRRKSGDGGKLQDCQTEQAKSQRPPLGMIEGGESVLVLDSGSCKNVYV